MIFTFVISLIVENDAGIQKSQEKENAKTDQKTSRQASISPEHSPFLSGLTGRVTSISIEPSPVQSRIIWIRTLQ